MFNTEMGSILMFAFNLHGKPSANLIMFMECITNTVFDMYKEKVVPASPAEEDSSYNPPKSCIVYYFNKEGKKIIENRLFSVDDIKNTVTFDDSPSNICNKHFPQVSKKGSIYFFLWFCPLHGHSYGFHIISGSEGHKDALASLYCYLG